LPAGWLLAAVAGVAAFGLNLSLLQRPVDEVRVAVAVRDLDPGSVLDAGRDLRFEPMAADDRLLVSHVTRPEQADGAVVAAPIAA
ncbi:MAG: hypothetical protein GWN79_28645, partial [Actinobacteria bacterium]|nr:hypothetical protein [Actinomycetota bacterium]NIS37236.1 hypothetical protein [Actinomycetota bacterium]NIT99155.1 hypothetical protein [Actinomycetota bacterium]NIU22765.1 hypothetical protein [Actinomycetota bacterium]NIU71667.1 hypothetical protein [Actinomycetota bacterium]